MGRSVRIVRRSESLSHCSRLGPSRPCLHPLYCLYPPLLLDPTGSDLGVVSERQLRNSRNSAFVQVCRILRIRSTRMRTATSHNWGKGPPWLRLRLPGRLRPSQARSLTSHDHYSRDVQWFQPMARWRAGALAVRQAGILGRGRSPLRSQCRYDHVLRVSSSSPMSPNVVSAPSPPTSSDIPPAVHGKRQERYTLQHELPHELLCVDSNRIIAIMRKRARCEAQFSSVAGRSPCPVPRRQGSGGSACPLESIE